MSEQQSWTLDPSLQLANNLIAGPILFLDIKNWDSPYEHPPEVKQLARQHLQEHPLKFDGTAWQLIQYTWSQQASGLSLLVVKGKYSQYYSTNLQLHIREKMYYLHSGFSALCIGSVLLTADNKIVYTQRSAQTHLSPGFFDLPCGHPTHLEDEPSNESVYKALRMVINSHFKAEIPIVNQRNLALIGEEPRHANDLMFQGWTGFSSSELTKQSQVPVMFLEFQPEAVAEFIRSNRNLSPPVRISLGLAGRLKFGERWFSQVCGRRD